MKKMDNKFDIKNTELLAPAGGYDRLCAAVRYGADAVYLAGKAFSLRAYAGNFDDEELAKAIKLVHKNGKKAFIALNIFAENCDFDVLKDYLLYLDSIDADALIIADPGILAFTRNCIPNMEIHLSTQANTTNKYSAKFWADQGVKRIVLARELSIDKIKEIRDFLPSDVELEAFVHGAMCISYSGRCLLSNYLTDRNSNRGECVQSCRWEYEIREISREGQYLNISEDERGSYILNSKDMNMIMHLGELTNAGITSFKIEGRAKTAYYVANTVNAYRRAIDFLKQHGTDAEVPQIYYDELFKSAHRQYFTGFYFGKDNDRCIGSSRPEQDYKFIAMVTDNINGTAQVEMRNRFKKGDELEILSPNSSFNKTFIVDKMFDESGDIVEDALKVQQKLMLECPFELNEGDILRMKV